MIYDLNSISGSRAFDKKILRSNIISSYGQKTEHFLTGRVAYAKWATLNGQCLE